MVGAEVYACTICMCMCTVRMGSNAGRYRVILDRLSGLVWRNIARSIWSLIGCRPGNGHLTCNKVHDFFKDKAAAQENARKSGSKAS